jgi:hypothetical protein
MITIEEKEEREGKKTAPSKDKEVLARRGLSDQPG